LKGKTEVINEYKMNEHCWMIVIILSVASFRFLVVLVPDPEWGHAVWRDELEIGYESWKIDEVEPDEYCSIHVHNVVRAKMGDQTGIGILETIVFGRHAPSGFQDLFDGAP